MSKSILPLKRKAKVCSEQRLSDPLVLRQIFKKIYRYRILNQENKPPSKPGTQDNETELYVTLVTAIDVTWSVRE